MKKIQMFLTCIFVLLLSITSVYAEEDPNEDNISTFDTSGPPFNPAQIKVNEFLKNYEECTMIEWKHGGAYQPVSNTDTKWQSEKLFHLMEMSEELSLKWEVQKAWFEKRTGREVVPWTKSEEDSKLFFLPNKTLQTLRKNSFLIQFPPFAKNIDNKLTPVPRWQDMFYLPTSCGTLVFVKYSPTCDKFQTPKSHGSHPVNGDELRAKVSSLDESAYNPNDRWKFYHPPQEPLYYIDNIYPPSMPIDSIAQIFIIKEELSYWENQVKIRQTAQTIAEIVPFAAVVRTIAQSVDTGWWEHKPLVTVADRAALAADILLDAIPVLAQASKFRKVSKTAFIIGSSAAVSVAIGTKIGAQGELKLDDYVRLVVLGMLSRDFRAMKVSDKVTDLEKGFDKTIEGYKTGLFENNLKETVAKVKGTVDYSVAVEKKILEVNKSFTIPKNVTDDTEALIKAYKLNHLPVSIAFKVIEAFKRNIKLVNELKDALVQIDRGKNNFDDLFETKLKELEISLTTRITPEYYKSVKFLNTLEEAQKSFPLNDLINSLNGISRKIDNKINAQGGYGALTAEEINAIKKKVYIDEIEPFYIKSLNGLSPAYNPLDGSIQITKIEIPEYYFEFYGELLPFYPPKGATPPFFGDFGAEVFHISNIKSDGTGGAVGVDQIKEAFDTFKKAHRLTIVEEMQHAANHVIESFQHLDHEGVSVKLSGVGFFKESHLDLAGEKGLAIAVVSQNAETINCLHWIKSLDNKQFQEIIDKYDVNNYFTYGYVKHDALDAAELDIFFAFKKGNVIVPDSFVHDRYLTRIFGQAFLDLGLHKN